MNTAIKILTSALCTRIHNNQQSGIRKVIFANFRYEFSMFHTGGGRFPPPRVPHPPPAAAYVAVWQQ